MLRLTIIASVAVALLVAFAIRPDDSARAVESCAAEPSQYEEAVVEHDPAHAPPGDGLRVILSNAPADTYDDEVRLYFNTEISSGGTLVATSIMQEAMTSEEILTTVPDLPPGDYYLVICWDSHTITEDPITYWQYDPSLFTLDPAVPPTTPPVITPTASAAPTATDTAPPTATETTAPTITPTATPAPTPAPSPTASPPPFEVVPYSFNVLPPDSYVAPFVPTEDLSIFGIEVTQGIQCFDVSKGLANCPDNSLPLVAGKDTAARIYLKYSGPATAKAGVPVKLHMFVGGQEKILDTSGVAGKTIRQLFSQANVWFHPSGFGGTISFYAEVDPDNLYAETNETNNRYPALGLMDIQFHTRRANFNVLGWRMNYMPPGGFEAGIAGGWAVNTGGAAYTEAIWPVRKGAINYGLHAGYLPYNVSIAPNNGEFAVLSHAKFQLMTAILFPWSDPALLNVHRLHIWTPRSHSVRGISDPSWVLGTGVVSVGDDTPGTGQTVDEPGFGATNFAHELSHNTGLFHTASRGSTCDSSQFGPGWPYPDATIQEFGFNPNSGRIYDPATTYDFMSYCIDRASGSSYYDNWISPHHWSLLYVLEGASTGDVHVESTGEDVLGISATLDNPDLDGDTGGSLGTLYKSDGGGNLAAPASGTGYTIELRDGDQVLGSQAFGASFVSIDDPEPTLPSSDIILAMPWVDGATTVVLLRGTTVLDTLEVSGNAPTVQVTSPSSPAVWPAGTTQTLTWTGADIDGDPLTYAVYYAPDGVAWDILTLGLTTPTFNVDVDSLAGGDNAKFRIVANDGLNTGYGDSASVSIPNQPPLVAITGPADGTVLQEGGLVVLSGGATDIEDGQLAAASLEWSSDKDGVLGTGDALPVNTLAAGEHLITLTATDRDGGSSSESISVIVGILGHLEVRPVTVDPDGSGDITVVLTLPPGLPVANVDLGSLRVQIGDTELTPLSVDQLSDLDLDGLPSITLVLDGDAARAAFTDEDTRVTVDLTGVMDDDTALAAHGLAGLIHPGDVNCSGETDVTDVAQALGYNANVALPTCIFAGDLDCDGLATPKDVLGTLGKLAGLIIGASSCPTPENALTASNSQFEALASDKGGSGFGAVTGTALLWPVLFVPALVVAKRRKKLA